MLVLYTESVFHQGARVCLFGVLRKRLYRYNRELCIANATLAREAAE